MNKVHETLIRNVLVNRSQDIKHLQVLCDMHFRNVLENIDSTDKWCTPF
jgi:hypothetical protein